MRITAFLYIFLAICQNADAECNTNLKPSDQTSKFIEALNCLNQEIIRIKTDVNNSKTISKDAASCCAATNEKLNRMFSMTTKPAK
jgi:hypothetical protein